MFKSHHSTKAKKCFSRPSSSPTHKFKDGTRAHAGSPSSSPLKSANKTGPGIATRLSPTKVEKDITRSSPTKKSTVTFKMAATKPGVASSPRKPSASTVTSEAQEGQTSIPHGGARLKTR